MKMLTNNIIGDKMKIKVIMTGGTIASEKNDNVITNNALFDVVDYYLKEKPESKSVFSKINIYSILSENIEIENWNSLLEELKKDYSSYDGIIITHGSDTLSYTSAMVSIFCKDFHIPVVLTGANKVLSDNTSNGVPNFTKAVDIICRGRIGVWTVFDKVYSADSVQEADCFTDRFDSGRCFLKKPEFKKDIVLKNNVLIIKAYPFADYSIINFSENIKAVLLIGYHSGTANEKSVNVLIKKCNEKGIKLYLQGQASEAGVYSSASAMEKSGVNILCDVTPEYAYAYLMFLNS